MNYIAILGRMTKEPEVRYTQNGKVVAQFTLAVDRPYSGQDGKREADFIPCVLWGKSAEVLGNTVSKGQRILVEGRLQIRNYEAKDGSKRYVTEVIASGFEYIEKKEQTEQAPFSNMGKEVTPQPFDESIPF